MAFATSLATITWLIGKFHLAGHKEECSKKFSFNYNDLVGRMSGELVETIWAAFNWLKFQTREMGPGPREETLSDAMNFWNWLKIVRMGELQRRLQTAQYADSSGEVAAHYTGYSEAWTERNFALRRLTTIQDAIGTDRLAEFQAEAAERGGEQFLRDKSRINCQ